MTTRFGFHEAVSAAHRHQTLSPNMPVFSISKILFLTSHRFMSKAPAKVFDLTHVLANASELPNNDLVARADQACSELTKDDQTREL